MALRTTHTYVWYCWLFQQALSDAEHVVAMSNCMICTPQHPRHMGNYPGGDSLGELKCSQLPQLPVTVVVSGLGNRLCSDDHRENWINSITDSLGVFSPPRLLNTLSGWGVEVLLSLELLLPGLGSKLHRAKFSAWWLCHWQKSYRWRWGLTHTYIISFSGDFV